MACPFGVDTGLSLGYSKMKRYRVKEKQERVPKEVSSFLEPSSEVPASKCRGFRVLPQNAPMMQSESALEGLKRQHCHL
jgi:hypothetical protein